MSTYAADDYAAIALRRAELEAERQEALTGSSAPVTGQEPKGESTFSFKQAMADYHGVHIEWKSLAHQEWPYAGTAHEWRGFVLPDVRGRVKASG